MIKETGCFCPCHKPIFGDNTCRCDCDKRGWPGFPQSIGFDLPPRIEQSKIERLEQKILELEAQVKELSR